MASKKAKEEVAQSQQPNIDTSNRGEGEGVNPTSSSVQIEGNGNVVIQESNSTENLSQEELTKKSDQEEQPEPEKEKPKSLHLLAADRLNQLIDEANELGITDVVQILNSDRTGQFYMVYKA